MWTKVGCSKTLQNLEELKTLFQFLTFYPHWLLSTWTDLSPNWRRVRLGTEISCRWGLVPQSCPALCDPQGLQHPRLPCPSLTPRVWSTSCPLSQRCHPTISSSAIPFSSCPQSFQHHSFFQWAGSSHQVAKVLKLQLQHQSSQWIFRVDFRNLLCIGLNENTELSFQLFMNKYFNGISNCSRQIKEVAIRGPKLGPKDTGINKMWSLSLRNW